MVDLAKISVNINFKVPENVKKLHSILWHIGYYRKFIQGYALIPVPMENFLKKDAKFC